MPAKYDKDGNDQYDRYKRMVRHKQDKYGVSTLKQRLKHGGVDHNIDNEKKAKMKEETEQLDEIAPVIAGAARVAVAGARVAGKVAARGAVAAGKGIAKGAKSTFKAAGRGVKKGVEQGSRAAAADVAATAISNLAKKKEEAKEKNLANAPSTAVNERADVWHPDPEKDRKLGGPGANQRAREDRAAASKPKSDPKKLKKGESYMDYAKRQKGASNTPAAKPKERKRDRVGRALGRLVDKVGGIKEEAPTMSAGDGGFSGSADANGPTAGYDPMMGVSKLTGKKPKCKKRKFGFKCEETEIEEGYVKDGKYFPFYVEIADTNFIFHGRSEADVKLKLRKIYRPEQMKNLSITRYQPAEVLSYYWNKRKESM